MTPEAQTVSDAYHRLKATIPITAYLALEKFNQAWVAYMQAWEQRFHAVDVEEKN